MRMTLTRWLSVGVAVLIATGLAVIGPGVTAQVAADADDIAGTVSGANGPEAGVWVIAETNDLPTHFTKIVVTDDQGRFVLPELPELYLLYLKPDGYEYKEVSWDDQPVCEAAIRIWKWGEK